MTGSVNFLARWAFTFNQGARPKARKLLEKAVGLDKQAAAGRDEVVALEKELRDLAVAQLVGPSPVQGELPPPLRSACVLPCLACARRSKAACGELG